MREGDRQTERVEETKGEGHIYLAGYSMVKLLRNQPLFYLYYKCYVFIMLNMACG